MNLVQGVQLHGILASHQSHCEATKRILPMMTNCQQPDVADRDVQGVCCATVKGEIARQHNQLGTHQSMTIYTIQQSNI
jgi:hypothetical protein